MIKSKESIVKICGYTIYLHAQDGCLDKICLLSSDEKSEYIYKVNSGAGKKESLVDSEENEIENSLIEKSGQENEMTVNNPQANLLIENKLQRENVLEPDEIIEKAIKELEEYFNGERREFDIPLHMEGTEFQKRVWNEIAKINYGETKTYGEIAKAIGKPKSARAVGNAANKNPLQFVVPCHRVIGQNGKLVGYASGLGVKKKLLDMEINGNILHKNNT